MSFRKISFRALALGLALVALAPKADAAFSTVGFVDLGNPTVNGSDLVSSTVFTIGDLVSKKTSDTNLFAGTPSTDFGTLTIDTAHPTNFMFTDPAFGTFHATSAVIFGAAISAPGVESLSIYVLGTFVAGTSNSGALGGGSAPASFTISFTQNGSSYNDSSLLSIPPASSPVPEPSSMALVVVGLGGVFAVRRARRRAV